MKRFAVTIMLAFIFISYISLAQEKATNKSMAAGTSITDSTNVHYAGTYCTVCHEKEPMEGGDKFLKFGGDYAQLCKCHGYSAGTYIHPVDIVPSEDKKTRIPDDLPLQDGKLSCLTCHDIYMQCKKSARFKLINKYFLRGAPYLRRTDICFKCHDEKKYKMLDPHNQLTADGEIIVEKCLYCHIEKPDEKRATFQRAEGLHSKEVKLIGNLEVLCSRCHYKQSKFHPINANHLQKPSSMTFAIMEEAEEKFEIILPLDYEGKITCATCHNPHERGVIPSERVGAKGASEKYRLRLPGEAGEICLACHKNKQG